MAAGDPDPDVEPRGERDFDRARTVALSDGVFAIALTLLVLNISAPVLAPSRHGGLGSALLDRKGELGSYALSFIVIAFMWVRHHGLFRVLERIDLQVTVLNLAYLGFVAFLPYPTRILGEYGSQPASVALYAATVAVVTTIAGLTRVYAQRAHLISEADLLPAREHWLYVPAIFLASIAIAFLSPPAARLSWLLLALPGCKRALDARRRTPRRLE